MCNNVDWTKKRVAGMLPQRYYTVDANGYAHSVSSDTAGAKTAHALDTLDGNAIQKNIDALQAQVDALTAKLS